jgi:hypothetical protein
MRLLLKLRDEPEGRQSFGLYSKQFARLTAEPTKKLDQEGKTVWLTSNPDGKADASRKTARFPDRGRQSA